jgi:YVTN family beta-propeller protein
MGSRRGGVRLLRAGCLLALGLAAVAQEAGSSVAARAVGAQAVTLAPSLSTPMSAPSGSLAPIMGPQNTAILPDGRLVTPAGRSIVTDAFGNNVVVSNDGRRIYVSSEAVNDDPALNGPKSRQISVIDPISLSRRRVRDDDLQYGLAETPDGKQLYVSEAGKNRLGVYDTATMTRTATVPLGSAPGPVGGHSITDFPWGLAVHPNGRYAYAVGYRSSTLDVIDTQSHAMIARPATGEFPFGVVVSPDGSRAYVTNWGMYNAELHDAAAQQTNVSLPPLAPLGYNGTQQSSVWTYDLTNPAAPAVIARTNIGQAVDGYHVLSGSLPSGMALSPDGRVLAVTGSNDDILVLLDARSGSTLATIDLHVFGPSGPTGAMPNAVSWARDGSRIFVAEGGINAVAVVDAASRGIVGYIPTGWYPAGVAVSQDGQHLYVSSDKGLGHGPNGFDHPETSDLSSNKALVRGTFQDVQLACADLAALSKIVARDNGLVAAPPEGNGTTIPTAFGGGGSSKIKHVVFILKENRTFDQVLGDLPGVERDQRLADLSGKYSPNHHAIAQRYATGDNLHHIVLDSTDGHWVGATGQENEFDFKVDPSEINGVFHGGDMIDGTAPENEPMGGMVWNHYKRQGITFKIWGEGLYLSGLQTTTPGSSVPNPQPGDMPPISNPAVDIETPTPIGVDPYYYPTQVPDGPTGESDEIRADDYVKKSIPEMQVAGMPQFSFLLLPNDHTNGASSNSLTPGSFMAVNDHALGRIVEGLSKSTLWSDTAVFVVEDDTQGGRDHVDAERVLSMVAGPYVKQGYVSHVHHSIYSILKTIDLILGAKPESVQEAAATSMADYFTDTPANSAPFNVVPYQVDAGLKNSAIAATGNAQFAAAAGLQAQIPADAVDFGPVTRSIQGMVSSAQAATGVGYSPPLSNIQEHTLSYAVPDGVPAEATSCASPARTPVPAVIRSLPDTAARYPVATLTLGAGLLFAAGCQVAFRRPWPRLRRSQRSRTTG